MSSTQSHAEIIGILNQGPRLIAEASQRGPNLNEAYMIVHGAMARALAGALLMMRAADDALFATSVTDALRQPPHRGETGTVWPSEMAVPSSVIQITLRRRIWRLTLDGAFYGDYRSERHAVESAEAAAVTMRRAGRSVKIIMAEGQTRTP
jgi:hypothetical protein